MISTMPIRIRGIGHYLPARIVTNDELEQRMHLRKGWIEKKTGVIERRWAEPSLSASMMADRASQEALHNAGIGMDDVSLILNASGTCQRIIPDNAPLFQREMGRGDSGIPCFSIHSTCLSFLSGIETAAALLATGRYENILLISADIPSRGLDFNQPESASLFGDGAAAVVLARAEPGQASALIHYRMETYGIGADLTTVNTGTDSYPFSQSYKPEDALFRMDGRKVYRLAQKKANGFLQRLTPDFYQLMEKVKVVVPHQSTMLGIMSLKNQRIDMHKVAITLPHFGNCVAASIPLTLYKSITDNTLNRGDAFLMLGTGAGLSLAAALMVY